MQRLRHILRIWICSLGLAILGLNLVMASVPRCTFLLSLFAGAHEHAAVAASGAMSCHETPAVEPSKGAQIKGGQFCECSLLSCLVFFLPDHKPDAFILFSPTTERVLVYPLTENRSNFIADLEAPPPRA